MSEFIPPYPYRFPHEPSIWQRLKACRKNLIGMWAEGAFDYDFVSTQVFKQRIFVCNTPETVQYAFNTRNAAFERKSPSMRHMLQPLIDDGLFISDGEVWRKRRRIVAPIIHVSNTSAFAPVMTDTARELADRWGALPDGTQIDALAEMAQLTAEIICRAIFGQRLGQERTHEIVEGFTDFQKSVSLIDIPSLFALPDWWPRLRPRSLFRSTHRIQRTLDEIIEACRNRVPGTEHSFIRALLDARDEETGELLSNDAIRNEAIVIFMAGHETTANTMAFAWFLLSQARDVEARLHEELDRVLGGRTPSLEDVPNLVYTRAIIEETLRLYPPIPVLAREAVSDEVIEGQAVPKRSMLLVVPFLLHRKRGLWEKPDHFMPERFLPGGGGPPSKWAYVPFSIGPRICAGMAFGLTEAIICLATLAQRFTLELEPDHVVEPVCLVSLRPGEHLPMRVHHRRQAAKPAMPTQAEKPSAMVCPFGHG
ncbi:Cytochrome P450 [Enhydrobacter aerosaccus]|uniref:Cytochrome P450 n=1 Tax=Enhydrobacter aerosaccus TaxID=225324 RepID=A0A1T4MTX7_9HYPH|nr:cytochrome P450 [Enhydrobacter aerosaccus]SJZ70306.1 Cytochrome P450 [Enhydrobacter aerosaccus]